MNRLVALRKRAWVLLGLGLVAIPLATAAIAYGCTALASLSVSPGAGAPGQVVTVNGSGFGSHDPAGTTNGLAEIRIGSATGPVLATAAPSGQDRSFSVQVAVPEMAAGDTVIIATQKTSTGTNVFGTPARQAFTVTAPAPRAGGTTTSGLTSSGQTVGTQQVTSTPVTSTPAKKTKAQIARAVAACNRKYNPRRAKSKRGKRLATARRAACIKRAKS